MRHLQAVIVDDERLARENLRHLLAAHEAIRVVGEARNAEEAELLIAASRPDLIFLDIQMPGRSGLDLLERLVSPPAIIFVTAFDSYAIRAFEVNALDYLLKPVEPERLATAIERAGKRCTAATCATGRLESTDRVYLDTRRQGIFLNVADIAAIRAERNYTRIFSIFGKSYLVRASLRHWQARLPAEAFLQLDRSLLINRFHVSHYQPLARHAQLYLGGIAQPFLLGRKGARRFKESILAQTVTPGRSNRSSFNASHHTDC